MWGLTSRVKGVNVDAEVDGLLGTDPVLDLLDDAVSANLVDFTCLDDLETAVAVVFVVGRPGKSRTDSSMDVGVVAKKTFLSSVEEVGAVVDGGLVTGRATEYLRLPGVEMAVKVDDTDGTVVAVYGAEKRESNSVIASKSYQAGQRSSLLRRPRLFSVGVGRSAQEQVVAFLDLLERKRIVVSVAMSVLSTIVGVILRCLRGNWDISAVNHFGPRVKRVRFQGNIVSATKPNPA